MADEKKKLYGGSYDDQINSTYQEMMNRPSFNYDVDGDALYQQYKDRYTQNAKMAMQDTMGQAAGLTGGYGNSYAQAVGQQQYDNTMRGLTDMIPTLEQNAYARYKDQGDALRDQLSMLNTMGATQQATTQQAYSQLAQLIGSSGYKPTEEELLAAGMNQEQANALLQMWIASNPDVAYANGEITPEEYKKLTGKNPHGYKAPGSGGGGYGGGGGSGSGSSSVTQDDVNRMMKENPNATPGNVSAWLQEEYGLSKEVADGMARTGYGSAHGA